MRGFYGIDRAGVVYRLAPTHCWRDGCWDICPRPLRGGVHKDGYRRYVLRIGGKRWVAFGHRLAAMTFLANPQGHQDVLHYNDDRQDNRVENLYWGNHRETYQRKRKRPVIGRNEIGQIVKFPSLLEASRQGFNMGCLIACCKGKQGTHAGYQWHYAS